MRLLRWLKRRWFIVLGTIGLVLLALAYLFPYLVKRYIEEHSEEWIHRKVSIGSIVLNPFSGVYAVNRFKCLEPESDAVFISFEKLGVKADLWDGYRNGVWHFREAELRTPHFHIEQDGDRFNFSDLLDLVPPDTSSVSVKDTTAVAFDVKGIAMTGGSIEYGSDILHDPVRINDLDVRCTCISSSQAVMDFLLAFGIGGGGSVNGGFTIDTEKGGYAVKARLIDFELVQVLPYLRDYMDCAALAGKLDLDLALSDSYARSGELVMSASTTVSGAEITDPNSERLLSLEQLRIELDTLIASNGHFEIGEVALKKADVRFRLLNDWSDNWTRLIKTNEESISTEGQSAAISESNILAMLADYVSYLGEQFVAGDYSAKSVKVADCSLRFEDYTPRLPFKYDITALDLAASSISSVQDAGKVTASAMLNSTGRLEGTTVFDPSNLRNMDVDLRLNGLLLTAFDPYSRWYAAHPIQKGTAACSTTTSIHDGRIDSRNAIRIEDLRFAKKVEDHDTGIYVLPLRFAAGLLKDKHGTIALDVPVTGDLKDPEFRPWPIVWQVLKNLIAKAVAAPGNLLARAVDGVDTRELEELRMEQLQAELSAKERRTLEHLAKALAAKPELRVDLVPVVDASLEEQEVALFMAKWKFLFGDRAMNTVDSAQATALAITDSAFTQAVNNATSAYAGQPLQSRCKSWVGAERVRSVQQDIEAARREHIMQYLLALGLDAGRAEFRDGKPEETAGRTGRPGYRFMYDVVDPSLDGQSAP